MSWSKHITAVMYVLRMLVPNHQILQNRFAKKCFGAGRLIVYPIPPPSHHSVCRNMYMYMYMYIAVSTLHHYINVAWWRSNISSHLWSLPHAHVYPTYMIRSTYNSKGKLLYFPDLCICTWLMALATWVSNPYRWLGSSDGLPRPTYIYITSTHTYIYDKRTPPHHPPLPQRYEQKWDGPTS